MTGQIKFNNLKSSDFKLRVVDVKIETPTPNVITQKVPYQNGEYDFTDLFGETTYSNRRITVTFEYDEIFVTKTRLNVYYASIVEWLYGAGESKLYIDFNEHYFKARVIDITPIELVDYNGQITAIFNAYPFRISEVNESHDIWDIFNFELDYAQDTKFTVNGQSNITLYNSGSCGITPTVICSSNFEIVKDNRTYKFPSGTSKHWSFIISKGKNELKVSGSGSIEFIFRKEML